VELIVRSILALDIAPSSREAVFTYVNLLTEQNRVEDAITIAEKAVQWSTAPERRTVENNLDRQNQTKLYRDLLNQLQAKKNK